MKSDGSSQIFTVPSEVYALLDPIERIVIRDQERRGLVKILDAKPVVLPS